MIKNLGDLPLGYLYDISWDSMNFDTWSLVDRSIWESVNPAIRDSVRNIVIDSVRAKYSQS